MDMARRAVNERNRGRVWRAAAGVSLIAVGTYGVTGAIAHADEPPVPPDTTVATGEVDGAVVAVGLPPVPPTSVVVEVGEPPVPPTSVVVEVGEPPVPPVTIPDAVPAVEPAPSVGSDPVDTVPPAAQSQPAAPQSIDPQLPETGPSGTTATAIVASAAASVGVALRALAKRP
jgi:hypothetical protein